MSGLCPNNPGIPEHIIERLFDRHIESGFADHHRQFHLIIDLARARVTGSVRDADRTKRPLNGVHILIEQHRILYTQRSR